MLKKINSSQIYFISFFISGFSTFIATSMYARLLTTDNFGMYSVGLAIFTLLNAFLFQWNKLSLLRNTDGTNDKKVFVNSLVIYAITAFVVFILLFLLLIFVDIKGLTSNVILYLITFSLNDLYLAYYRASLKAKSFFVLTVLKSIFSILIVYCYLTFFGSNSDNLFLAMTLTFTISLLIVLSANVFISNSERTSLSILVSYINYREIKKQVNFGVPLTLSLLCSNATYSLMSLIGLHFLSTTTLGVFTAYFTVIQKIITTLGMACNSFSYTKLVRDFKSDINLANLTLQKNLILILNFIVPAFLFLYSNSTWFFNLYFPIDYQDYNRNVILLIFISVMIFSIKMFYLDHVYHLELKTGKLFHYSLCSLLLFLCLVFPLVQYLKTLGLVVSMLCSYLLGYVLLVINAKRYSKLSLKPDKKIIYYCLVSLILFLVCESGYFNLGYLKIIMSFFISLLLHLYGWYLYLKRIKA